MNLPNKLTMARCIMAIILVAVMSIDNLFCYVLAYALFCAAALTDYLDGRIARSRGLVTNFGKLFDPVADKVLMLAALIMLMTIDSLRIPGWTIVVIFAREFLIMGARAVSASGGEVIAANRWGKRKTTLQILYVLVFLFLAIFLEVLERHEAIAAAFPAKLGFYQHYVGTASRLAIIFVALYTVYSGFQFARINWNSLDLNDFS